MTLMTTSNMPALDIAWEQYKKDNDDKPLLKVAFHEANQRSAFQLLLWRAIGIGDWNLVKTLEEHQVVLPDNDDCTPGLLYQAICDFGDAPEAIKWLLNHGAKKDKRGPNDWTPLHYACRSGYFNTVSMLVTNGSDVNAQTCCDGGWTPLMEACASGSKDVVKFLLAHGADPEIRNLLEGVTARGIAILRGHSDVAAVLDSWSASSVDRKRVADRLRS